MKTTTAHVTFGVLAASALALALAASGCAAARQPATSAVAPVPAAPVAAPASPEPSGLSGAAAVNAFGLDLMRARLASVAATQNVVLSPLSVHAALSMTLQGARGNTAAEMQRALHLSGDATAAASTYVMLLSALNDRSKAQTLTRLKIDEKGTEAAAATVVEMARGSVMRSGPTPVPFICDRPFAFAIIDTKTGALLFLSAIRNPQAK